MRLLISRCVRLEVSTPGAPVSCDLVLFFSFQLESRPDRALWLSLCPLRLHAAAMRKVDYDSFVHVVRTFGADHLLFHRFTSPCGSRFLSRNARYAAAATSKPRQNGGHQTGTPGLLIT